jgi:succinate-semialdehyde dehydrogenase/glutarate-semialdehyde dehydrogenase
MTALSSASAADRVPHELFIAGRWQGAAGVMPVVNPATEGVIAEVADATVTDAHRALRAAADAHAAWAATPARTRSEILYRTYELMVERTEWLAEVMTLEMGKPLPEARGEVAYAADIIRWFAEEAVRIDGGYAHRPDGAARNLQFKQPVGPCLLIVPWNFPLAMGARKVGPAIAAGCTSILKPAPQTPLTSLAFAQLLSDAGLPGGVVNVLPTSRAAEIVPPLLDSGAIRKLSFTGSTEVGKLLLGQAARHVIRTSMELGGNAPFLVLDDADPDIAVEAAFTAKMRNMGEACTAANRFIVHADMADEFATRLGDRLGALTVGDGLQDGIDVGPLIDHQARKKVVDLMRDALDRGATVVAGGGCPDRPGYFVEPTVLTDVAPDSALNSTEIFGPLAAIQTFVDLDDAVARANDTHSGLVGYVITRDLDRALTVTERLEVGMVGLNTGIVSTPSAPFGGIKHSGLGREGGRLGIEEFLETKYVSIPVRR